MSQCFKRHRPGLEYKPGKVTFQNYLDISHLPGYLKPLDVRSRPCISDALWIQGILEADDTRGLTDEMQAAQLDVNFR